MSEYVEIRTELSDNSNVIHMFTNLRLTVEGPEEYDSAEAMEEGTPIAQALSVVQDVLRLRLDGTELAITRAPGAPWHMIVADVSAVLRDFFL